MSPEDLAALTSADGQQALVEHGDSNPQYLALNPHRYPGQPIRAIAEQLHLRRRYGDKFGDWLPHILLQQRACEQAASQALARWKAQYLLPHHTDKAAAVVDCCAGLGSDILAVAECGYKAQAWEQQDVLAEIVRHNAQALGLDITVGQGDGCRHLGHATVVLADPDRRASGKRSLDPAEWSPQPQAIFSAATQAQLIMLKIPVGANATSIASPGQRQLLFLSQGGEAREQLLLIQPQLPAREYPPRAVGLDMQGRVRFDISGSSDDHSSTTVAWDDIGPICIEPDPAIIRSGLIAHLAQQHGLRLLHPQVAYLHGPDPGPDFPGTRYQVLEHGIWQEKVLRKRLRQLGITTLRISRRHFPWAGEHIHQRLRTREGGSMRLFCFRNGDETMAWALADPMG